MRIISLPESAHVATNVAGNTFREFEARIPAQRTVAENPHAGAHCSGSPIMLMRRRIVIIIIIAVLRVTFASTVIQLK